MWLRLALCCGFAAGPSPASPASPAGTAATLGGSVHCSEWPRGVGGWRGGPAHCTCPHGQAKTQAAGLGTRWGWHCLDAEPGASAGSEKVQLLQDTKSACELDAVCSHCRGEAWPVCGVDGHTYSSACRARCRCVGVAAEGECNGWQSAGAAPPKTGSSLRLHRQEALASLSARVHAATTTSQPAPPANEATVPAHLSEWSEARAVASRPSQAQPTQDDAAECEETGGGASPRPKYSAGRESVYTTTSPTGLKPEL